MCEKDVLSWNIYVSRENIFLISILNKTNQFDADLKVWSVLNEDYSQDDFLEQIFEAQN